jgi:hypothetical protein
MSIIIRTALAIAMFAIPLKAEGLKITFKTSTDKKEIHYHSATHSRIDDESGASYTLVDYSNSVSYSISHEKKAINKFCFDDVAKIIAKAVANSPGSMHLTPEIIAVLGLPNKATVKKSTEKIAGRTCQKYRIAVGRINLSLSVDSKLLPSGPQDSHIRQMATEALPMMFHPLMGPYFIKLYEEAAKIKGTILKSEMQMPRQPKAISEAINIEEGPLPGSLFELPEGYAEEDAGKNLLQRLGGE